MFYLRLKNKLQKTHNIITHFQKNKKFEKLQKSTKILHFSKRLQTGNNGKYGLQKLIYKSNIYIHI